jgi:hypothetical protein
MVIWGRFESLLGEVDLEALESLVGDPSLLLLYQEFVASKWLTNSSFVRDLESEKQMLAKRLYWDEALLVELAPLYQPPALIFGPGVHTRL